MKHIFFGSFLALCVSTHAHACDVDASDLSADIKMVLADGPQGADVVRYLSDAFFDDLACRIAQSPGYDPSIPVSSATIDDAIGSILTARNQTDALVLILTAMQGVKPKGG